MPQPLPSVCIFVNMLIPTRRFVLQEPHWSAYKYLFELVGALKHVVVTRKPSWFSQFQETENRARVSALRSRTKKRKGRKSNS
ncbi:hypothetical protein Ahy_B08g094365 [Arachis hypogaea]|uniref:Uncharacterized protein n=1 Tax=Arachis hypogaea TaxID=3818 RepID=A0A444Y8Y8_ARAHY|nr:hypothetical protein Ahy_B08g094365 [Arachis hypogaea]